jgi:hypothetical protein
LLQSTTTASNAATSSNWLKVVSMVCPDPVALLSALM